MPADRRSHVWPFALGFICFISQTPFTFAASESLPFLEPLVHTIEADSDAVWSSDIVLTDSRLRYEHSRDRLTWDAAFSYASFDINYRPFTLFDFLGFTEHLHEDRLSGRASIRYAIHDRLTLLGGAGAYDGYPDYRRVWIANRYRQKYANPNFPRIPGYEDPNPKGWNLSTGARWEYLPDKAFAELKLGYASEETAPGYEDSFDAAGNYKLLRGREHLDTKTLGFSSENVLTSWLRALNEFGVIKTSSRELRFRYRGSLNVALGPWWVLRGYGGITTEEPRFDAYYFGGTLEYEALRGFFIGASGRYYKDTGEIENSLLTSSAAPPLQSWEGGLGLRYVWGHSAVKLYVAAFRTDYDPIRIGTAEFTYLYQDRNWGLAQIVYSLQF